MTIYTVYDQIAELIASLPTSKVMSLQPPQEVSERFEYLVLKNRNEQLTFEEKDELNHFVVIERLIRLAKIRTVTT